MWDTLVSVINFAQPELIEPIVKVESKWNEKNW